MIEQLDPLMLLNVQIDPDSRFPQQLCLSLFGQIGIDGFEVVPDRLLRAAQARSQIAHDKGAARLA
ncbi:hypothetical protein D3C77_465930 [compost metagenome]